MLAGQTLPDEGDVVVDVAALIKYIELLRIIL